MIKDKSFLEKLGERTTEIQTASQGAQQRGTFAKPRKFLFADGKTPVRFGKQGEAVFCDHLSDNLASVGRLCENGFLILFGTDKYQIFSEKDFKYKGAVIHTEARCHKTGLYPSIFLVKPSQYVHNLGQPPLRRAQA